MAFGYDAAQERQPILVLVKSSSTLGKEHKQRSAETLVLVVVVIQEFSAKERRDPGAGSRRKNEKYSTLSR